jgi:hypothetical protein
VSAELAARRTAAGAALADFRREALDEGQTPDYSAWAVRLATEVRSLLEQLECEPAENQLAQIRLVLDHFDWETDDRQYALEQIDDILRSAP